MKSQQDLRSEVLPNLQVYGETKLNNIGSVDLAPTYGSDFHLARIVKLSNFCKTTLTKARKKRKHRLWVCRHRLPLALACRVIPTDMLMHVWLAHVATPYK